MFFYLVKLADIFTPQKRSYIMSRIRSKNTKIERITDSLLEQHDIPYKAHPKIFGNPDFKIGEKTLVFCDGDFWHGYNYKKKKKPPRGFWRKKIQTNMKRDLRVRQKLRREGWSVIRLWEHDIEKRPDFCLDKIIRHLN